MATDERTRRPLGSATIVSRRRFLKQTAMATAVVSVPYLAGKKTVASGKEGSASGQGVKGADATLDRALKELVAMEGGPPGAIAIVQRGNHREVHSFGVRNIKSGLPLRADDHMRQASTSKAYSGAVALSLVSKGALSLNDTIGELLPDLPDSWSEVTLRQLLNHTSGLPDFTKDQGFLDALLDSPKQAPQPRELLSFVENERLNFEPGTQYEYSSYDNVPSQQPPEDLSEVLASGWFWASGGMVTTPSDLNAFVRGYVGGDLFDLKTRARQRKVFEGGASDPPGPGKNSAGLGIFRYETRCGTVWGHTGNYPGYTQFLAASPNGKRSVTVAVNEQLSPVQGAPGVFDALRHAEVKAVCAALAD